MQAYRVADLPASGAGAGDGGDVSLAASSGAGDLRGRSHGSSGSPGLSSIASPWRAWWTSPVQSSSPRRDGLSGVERSSAPFLALGSEAARQQRRLLSARCVSAVSLATCVALVVISVTSPPDWTHVVGTTGNGFQYVTDQAHGGGSSGDGRINGGRRREAVEASSNATAHGGGGSGDGLLLRLPSCSEPLYGAPPAAQGFFTSGAADAVPSAGDAPQPRASPDTYPHPYLRPVPDPEMADYRSRVESYLASPAFQSRVRQLRALGPGSDGGAASGGASSGAGSGERYPDGSGDASRGSGSGGGEGCEGCAPEGILISAGGPRLLTNVMVLLRVLRFHLNCTLPVEIAWAGPQELPGAAFRRPPKRDIPDVGSGDQVEGDTAHRGLRLHERQRDQGLHDVHVQAQQRATAEEEKEEEEEEPPAGDLFIGALRDAGLGPVYGLDLSRVPYPGHHRRPPKLTHWGAKVYSLLASGRFRRVLLLDADILPLADPRVALLPLLLRSPPPLPGREAAGEAALPQEPSRGFLVWSDAWRGWAGPAAYRELGLEPEAARLALNQVVGVVGNGSRRRGANDGGDGGGADDGGWSGRWGRRDAESGAVLIDRVAHADVLEYLWWINSFGDRLYHRLLHGDKDTFALAFAAAGKAHCYSQVALPPGGVFQWGRGVLEIKSPPPPAGDAVVADGGATASGPADPPPPPPAPADGWQLVGFTQHHPLNGQPLLLHRTMDKWPPLKPPPMMMTMTTPKSTQPQPQAEGGWLDVAERGWPVQVLTGPLPTRWCEYHLAHDNRGPTKGVSWQHVVPEAAIRLVPHPAYGSKTTTATTTTAAATRPANTSHPAAAAGLVATAAAGAPSSEIPSTTPPAAAAALCDVQRYTEILRGAAAGLPTAGSAAVEGLHAACARQLRSSLMESRRGTAPHGGGRHAAIAAAAAAAMSPPWGIRDRQVAVALAEALMQVPYSLPSWPSLHAALLHDGMTEAQLERPYWPPVLQPQQHPSAWPPPPSPLLGLAVCLASPGRGRVPTPSESNSKHMSSLQNVMGASESGSNSSSCSGAGGAGCSKGDESGASSGNSRRFGESGGERIDGGEPEVWRRLVVVSSPGCTATGGVLEREGGGSTRSRCDLGGVWALASDDTALAAVAASYWEHEWVLAAAARGQWPELVES